NGELSLDDPLWGDFDIRRSMTINGNGAYVRGERKGRVFQISNGANVTLNSVNILNGGYSLIGEGAGMHISGGSHVKLNDVTFYNNTTGEYGNARGGAIFAHNEGGSIEIRRGEFDRNEAR